MVILAGASFAPRLLVALSCAGPLGGVPPAWEAVGMVASFDEFAAEHRAEHRNAFNRWCAAVGNPLFFLGTVAMLSRNRRAGAALVSSGAAVLVAGHVAEGTLSRALRDLARHPVWSVRADVGLARETIVGGRPLSPLGQGPSPRSPA